MHENSKGSQCLTEALERGHTQGYILVDLNNDEQDVYLILEKKVQFKISVV